MPNILALDVGLSKTGYVIIDHQQRILNSGLITTRKVASLSDKLKFIYTTISKLIGKYNIKEIAIEKFFMHRFSTRNLSPLYVYGLIFLLGGLKSIKISEYNPKQIKKFITGYGNADKKSMEKMIKLRFKNIYEKEDVIDALAIGLYHLQAKCYPF